MSTNFEPISGELERLAKIAVNAAYQVHSTLGPGLLESVYEVCMMHEFAKIGILAERQLAVPVLYDGVLLDAALRIDILVGGKLILELKAVEQIAPVHKAQLITYLKLTNRRLWFLINFNVPVIKDGIKRIVYG
jgi:GxxExxY protein